MNKSAIRNFAVWARNRLKNDVRYAAGLIGVTEKGIAQPLPQSTMDTQFFDIGTKDYVQLGLKQIRQRNALIAALRTKQHTLKADAAFDAIVEEVAYTWFNRLVAIRFMEVNDYLPGRVRVLSSENPSKKEPDLVTSPFEGGLDFNLEEENEIRRMQDQNQLDDLFRMLFIKECESLNKVLPVLFGEVDNWTELLLNISFTDPDGVVYHLTHDIEESNFNVEQEGQIEIVGWLYQYYNSELKDETFALLKKNVKITKERIPSATQLFTPDWIVRYMVENSLGRLWVEGHPNDDLKAGWSYYLEEAEQDPPVAAQLAEIRKEYASMALEDIKVIDPCMGSGHILVYAFDVLMQIYLSQGYTERDAVRSILENNLYGLDIDRRAAQLAYFAVMMKARQYDRRILTRGIMPHVIEIVESHPVSSKDIWTLFGPEKEIARNLHEAFIEAKSFGSILTLDVKAADLRAIQKRLEDIDEKMEYGSLSSQVFSMQAIDAVSPLMEQARLFVQQYDVVVTNPPYMGSSNMSPSLVEYIKNRYPAARADLSAVFVEHGIEMCKQNRYVSMITPNAWMFLYSYELFRQHISKYTTVNMAHLGPRAFDSIGGEVVQTTAFTMRNKTEASYFGTYLRLVQADSENAKKELFLSGENRYFTAQDTFDIIPGKPIAYWISKHALNAFKNESLGSCFDARNGMSTTDNDRFLRLWFECATGTIGLSCENKIIAQSSGKKWFPYSKGGSFRRWYGNNDYVVNWFNDGEEMKQHVASKYGSYSKELRSEDRYFTEGLTWSTLSSGNISLRYCPAGALFDSKGSKGFAINGANLFSVLAYLNSCVTQLFLSVLSPTLDYNNGSLNKLPLIQSGDEEFIRDLAQKCVGLCKTDWDCFETSWDFQWHPLIRCKSFSPAEVAEDAKHHIVDMNYIEEAFTRWSNECYLRFTQLRANEEKLNSIFIENYGLQDDLIPDVAEKDVTVRKADLQREIKSLISYAVGCMLGRYSLDVPGLAFAGGEWDASKYQTYQPDNDNCLPITDEDYGLKDDIVSRFVDFIRVVYGEETLEKNLQFIADSLGNKGATARETIRLYFLNDFFKDHCATYSVTGSGKRPIYWLFDSGKQNGFKALVYMHRWNVDTAGNVRVEYLHRMQHVYESEIQRMQETIEQSHDSKEIARAEKRLLKLQKQLKETRDYDAMLGHIALSRINIDLDDGVKVNYEKVQTGRDGKKLEVLAKI